MHRRLNIALRTATCVVAVALAAGPAAAASTDAERIATYQLFRSAFDASDYAVALPLAERLATQTEEQYGADSRELVNPLTNVGTVQFRLGNTAAAETAYQRGLRLIDGKAPGADRMLIRPLQGLGETYLTLGRHAEAATALKRAVPCRRRVGPRSSVVEVAGE